MQGRIRGGRHHPPSRRLLVEVLEDRLLLSSGRPGPVPDAPRPADGPPTPALVSGPGGPCATGGSADSRPAPAPVPAGSSPGPSDPSRDEDHFFLGSAAPSDPDPHPVLPAESAGGQPARLSTPTTAPASGQPAGWENEPAAAGVWGCGSAAANEAGTPRHAAALIALAAREAGRLSASLSAPFALPPWASPAEGTGHGGGPGSAWAGTPAGIFEREPGKASTGIQATPPADDLDIAGLTGKAGALLEGGLPFDLATLGRDVEAFFARLAPLGEAGEGLAAYTWLVPWLALVSAAAFALARRGRRSSGGPAPFLPEEES